MELPPITDHYHDCYVAFIDILGFSEHVIALEGDPAQVKELISAMNVMRNAVLKDTNGLNFFLDRNQVIQATTFSDNIVISCNRDRADAHWLIQVAANVCRDLLRYGYMTRGGISHGLLHHSNSVVMGEGLISAFRLESKTANYPRILIHPDCVDELADASERFSIREDFDGLHYLDYLSESLRDAPQGISRMREKVCAQMNHNDPGIRAKTRWMANFMNNRADVQMMEPIPT